MRKRVIDPAKLDAFKEKKQKFQQMPTVSEWLLDWLSRCISRSCKPSTLTNYTSYALKHIIPILGDYLLSELEPAMILYFIHDQLANGRTDGKGGLSYKTVQEYRNMLHLALQKALEEGYISSNPCQYVQVPRQCRSEVRTLRIEEQEQLHKDIRCEWQPSSLVPVLLGMYAGMRIGEIAGLQIQDIDLKQKQIRVQRSLNRFQDENGQYTLRYGTTKSGNSRIIPMNEDLYEALRTYMDTMPSANRKSQQPLFINKRGNAMEPRMINYYFHKLMDHYHIPDVHFHCLRHTFATRALEANMNIKVCSKILGHASTRITADIYTHVTVTQMMKEMKKLDMEHLKTLSA